MFQPNMPQNVYRYPSSVVPLRGVGAIDTGHIGTAWMVVATASSAASAFHGYKRNGSIGWALWWGFMGGLFPVFTPAIALAQGFGKPAAKKA